MNKVANGLCRQCGKPAPEKQLCDKCAPAKVKRYPKKSQWAAVDWSLPTKEIAGLLGVTMMAVRLRRKSLPNAV